MSIQIKGAKTNNLKNVSLEVEDCMTVFTGVSGSGKSSLVFDTLYYEARRRLFSLFRMQEDMAQMTPPDVESITGLRPAIAIQQNVKNRNPKSTLATATGMHVLLRMIYANFGTQHCARCGASVQLRTEDIIAQGLVGLSAREEVEVSARLLNKVAGSHRSLLQRLYTDFPDFDFVVDGEQGKPILLEPIQPHTITIRLNQKTRDLTLADARQIIETAKQLGLGFLLLHRPATKKAYTLPFKPVCTECNTPVEKLKPPMFNKSCPHCNGKGCFYCIRTGMYPAAARTTWLGMFLPNLLRLSLEDFHTLIKRDKLLPESGQTIHRELLTKCASLHAMGLGYLTLDRPSPTFSRGEYQRLQIARAIANDLEDVMYLLDEPTIGLHPAEVRSILPRFRDLKGTVLTIEHDRQTIIAADRCVELGPGAGAKGGQITFEGEPAILPGASAEHPAKRLPVVPKSFITITGAKARNLKDVDVSIPVGALTVVTGVSGSGKSTLVEEVLLSSLERRRPINSRSIDNPIQKAMFVDQDPIGANSQSSPATYTKLFDDLREYFAFQTGRPASFFLYNAGRGSCPVCGGQGRIEVKMRYLPSAWLNCPKCKGRRYAQEVLETTVPLGGRELSIADVLDLQVSELWDLIESEALPLTGFARAESLKAKVQALMDVGLSYIKLGQPAPTLSGGEAQRVKLALLLGQRISSGILLVFDEPTTGLHDKDVAKILAIFDRLKEKEITVLVIEHNVDVMRYADWLIELGPGSGPQGGKLLYMGPPEELAGKDTKTAVALRAEPVLPETNKPRPKPGNVITIQNAHANNLKNLSLRIPKNELVVITGVSGSGKSTLVWDVLEAEAKRRYLETLTVYERYNIHEARNQGADEVTGLGFVCSIAPEKLLYNPRSTIGSVTGIYRALTELLAAVGNRNVPDGKSLPPLKPESFSPGSYTGACTTCQGVGTVQHLNENKIIIHPDKPLLKGAMYSPGFFPKGFLGKPGNSGYYFVRAFAKRYRIDPESTPWKEMSEEARHKFLYGDPEPMKVNFINTKGQGYTDTLPFPGFSGWIKDWDLGGTYTDHLHCPDCGGSGLKPEYNRVTLLGHTIYEMCQLSMKELQTVMQKAGEYVADRPLLDRIWRALMEKLRFMNDTGLSYVHLARFSSTLSAGEAQRVKLTTLLENEMNGLLVLLDEPTRGLHGSEVDNLIRVMRQIQQRGNTLLVVEHDTRVMEAADCMIEIGPGAGKHGGEIVANGPLSELLQGDTVTARWIRQPFPQVKRPRRQVMQQMTIQNATENNLHIDALDIPLGVLTGICGVSGSGKSTLIIDTIARSQVQKRQTTSVSYDYTPTGAFGSITGMPKKIVVVDQSKAEITPLTRFTGIDKYLREIYQTAEDAAVLGLSDYLYKKSCTECGGKGVQRVDMEFMAASHVPCEACGGSGFSPEAWKVRVKGYAYPELFGLSIEELYEFWKEHDKIAAILGGLIEVGLGYLIFGQPPHSFSAGEAQRLKLAMPLRKKAADTLYILDEPTTGLHSADAQKLINLLHRLVEKGNSVWVVEHQLNLLASCDYLIELGPGGGPEGGRVVAQGTPEQLALADTATGNELKEIV